MTAAEITAAVAKVGKTSCGGAAASTNASAAASTNASTAATTNAQAATTNVQTFTGTLGGAAPPVEKSSGDRPFSVNGNTFVNAGAALQRSCSIQNNACADAANAGSGSFSVADCGTQEDQCNAAATTTTKARRASRRKHRRAALDFES